MKTNPLTIAIAHDHDLFREQARLFIKVMGHTVVLEARNGHELLDKLARVDKLPDLCLLDVNMPALDGGETARQLQQRFPSVRTLAISLFGEKEKSTETLTGGAKAFSPKEGSLETWRKMIDDYISSL